MGAIFSSTNKNHVRGNGHLAWIKGTALHKSIHRAKASAASGATGIEDASVDTKPHELDDDEMNYKPCPKCKGGKKPPVEAEAKEDEDEEKKPAIEEDATGASDDGAETGAETGA